MSAASAVSERSFDLAVVNSELENAPAEEILRWAASTFPHDRLGLVSAFGPGSAVLIHLLADIAPDLPVVFVDTLHHFPETLRHVETVRARYGLNLRVYRPESDLAAFEEIYGERLWERDLELYQRVSKVEPFRRATDPLDAWFTGRRRDQASTRASLPAVEVGDKIRINPLAGWTRSDLWSFILENQLPYNSLHDRGYTSIGDAPLTSPVSDGEDERAGRWRGSEKLECGIHLP
jgi:phosphoadenosine phosphosulfate reductase